MKRIYRVIGFAYLVNTWFIREPIWILQGFTWLVGLAVILFSWGGLDSVTNYIAVFILVNFSSLSISLAGQEYGWNKILQIEEMFRASPATYGDYVLGLSLGTIAASTIYSAPSIPLAYYLGIIHVVPQLLILGVSMVFIGTEISIFIVKRVKNPMNISALLNPLSTVLTLLPPIFYPATVLPHPLAELSNLLPQVAAAEYARRLIGMETVYPGEVNIAVIIVWTIITLLMARGEW